MNQFKIIIFLIFCIICSCNDNHIIPKQNAFLRIEFNEPEYEKFIFADQKMSFYYNKGSSISIQNKIVSMHYKKMKMSLDLKFNKLNNKNDIINNMSNFRLLLDTHVKRSNGVFVKEYENSNSLLYGNLYELSGDVASPIHFYITDSLSNFIHGSLNIKSKSKYDSIYPSIQYIKNDVLVFFESINLNYNNETK